MPNVSLMKSTVSVMYSSDSGGDRRPGCRPACRPRRRRQERDEHAEQDGSRRPAATPAAAAEPVDARLDRRVRGTARRGAGRATRQPVEHVAERERAGRNPTQNTTIGRDHPARHAPSRSTRRIDRSPDASARPPARSTSGPASRRRNHPHRRRVHQRTFGAYSRDAVAPWGPWSTGCVRDRRFVTGSVGPGPERAARRAPSCSSVEVHGGSSRGAPIKRVHADASMFVGGLRALLLQSLHPLAMAGVAQHSDYRTIRGAGCNAPPTSSPPPPSARPIEANGPSTCVRRRARPRHRGRARRPTVLRQRPASAAVGAPRRDSTASSPPTTATAPTACADPSATVRRRDRRDRPGARGACTTGHRAGAARPAPRVPPRAAGTAAARDAARYLLLQPPLPLGRPPGVHGHRRRGRRLAPALGRSRSACRGSRCSKRWRCAPLAMSSPAPSGGPSHPDRSSTTVCVGSLRTGPQKPDANGDSDDELGSGRARGRRGRTTMPFGARATRHRRSSAASSSATSASSMPGSPARALHEQRAGRPVGLQVDARRPARRRAGTAARSSRTAASACGDVDLDPVVEAEQPLAPGRGTTPPGRTG